MVNYKYFFFSLVVIVLKIALNTTGHRISTYFAYIVILLTGCIKCYEVKSL